MTRPLPAQLFTAAILIGLLSVPATFVAAQEAPDTEARRAAMERLSFLEGQWSGDAWAVTGPGVRLELRQTESFRFAVGGQVLLVEGVGRTLSEGVVGDTVFHAAATIDWQPDRGYLMRSYTLQGHYGEFDLEVTDGGFAWGLETPGGTVEYRMQLTPEGLFDERGFFIMADGREIPTFGMLLERVGG